MEPPSKRTNKWPFVMLGIALVLFFAGLFVCVSIGIYEEVVDGPPKFTLTIASTIPTAADPTVTNTPVVVPTSKLPAT